jgi:hypothetical protein
LLSQSFAFSEHGDALTPGQSETYNVAERVFNGGSALTAADNGNEITLGSHLGKRDDIVARGQSPTTAVPKKSMVGQVIVVVAAEDVEHHSAAELRQILSLLRPRAPQLIG